MEFTFTINEIEGIAKKLLTQLEHKVVLFDAEMGVGKTTLIKELVKELGVKDPTNSPTFSIVNEYLSETTGNTVYHFDLYRIEDEEEAYDMGLDEYLDSGNWCFIEWPEKTPNLIPIAHSTIKINLLQDGSRKLTLNN
ncbi:tRNA (adenosine(37)-N6)-threonylcarbamoyltransferase complex ATPase subunit type 1 TsaE [Myroides guanonis]|uniref:tRNA threonylcarbamoyladenosine biosynthesis protein TsaE n=1 Tax=Myroides guanonis TaxID=1150112 RepID=A0A1I3LFB6_9FLAO|nr:tRNA (adenosine(37)-N6)-threonylcarbamoyltransferase complex ATPase subunit type 1 TsaE [Myroides guanonis]SFI83468.1 tRNA threonylcarbamoyladenosine biosynthesis protein TsaE [Myroides guanonis]